MGSKLNGVGASRCELSTEDRSLHTKYSYVDTIYNHLDFVADLN